MNTAVVAAPAADHLSLTVVEVKARVQLIQQVMRGVMKDGVHYGKIPGAGERKSLFKPGAEVLCTTFRIAPSYRIDDLSDSDHIRYRVTCIGTHQGTGVILGEGMGEASTNEEKYRWRNAVCDEEFDAALEDRKRSKWQRGQNGVYQRKQVRTEPADIANTVLKMACKRAQVAMTINVTGASDIFTQDLEDMPEEVRQTVTEGDHQPRQQGKPATTQPQSNGGNKSNRCTEKQAKLVKTRLDNAGIPEKEFFSKFEITDFPELPFGRVDEALGWISQANAG